MQDEILGALDRLRLKKKHGNVRADIVIPMLEAFISGQVVGFLIFQIAKRFVSGDFDLSLALKIGVIVGCVIFLVNAIGDQIGILYRIWRVAYSAGRISMLPQVEDLKRQVAYLQSKREQVPTPAVNTKEVADGLLSARVAGEIALIMIELTMQGKDIARRAMEGMIIKTEAGEITVNQINWGDAHRLLVHTGLKEVKGSLKIQDFEKAQDLVIAAVDQAVNNLKKGEQPAWCLRR